MFGIKTKKDKRIEELENQLSNMYFEHPHIVEVHGNKVTLAATEIIENYMPVDYAKQMIAKKLVNEAIKFIHYDVEQYELTKKLKGYIQVITYGSEE